MDSSSLHEPQKEYQETEDEIVEIEDEEIAETEDQIVETGDKTEQQTETITNMGCELYWAAESGDISAVLEWKDHLQILLTPNKNTILHIYITSRTTEDPDPTKFVKKILKNCPALLMQPNTKNETPLHIAARYGHASMVGMLIQHAKALHPENLERGVEEARKMMRMRNQNLDTAFHEAVRFKYIEVVKILVKEDCDFVYLANKEGETPLYMAAERGYRNIVFEILHNCKSPATGGPIGRNVLHAAATNNDKEMIKKILEKMGDLMLKEADENGLTPLHHAAYIGYLPAVELFLRYPIGREAAYMKSKIGNTALHLAAQLNNKGTMSEIIKRCPDCCELVNNKGWNILHSAVHGRDTTGRAMRSILKMKALSNLLNEKDDEGNTPLHYIANSANIHRVALIHHPRVDKMAFNKQNKNALDLASTAQAFVQRKISFKRLLKKKGLRLQMRYYRATENIGGEQGNKKEGNNYPTANIGVEQGNKKKGNNYPTANIGGEQGNKKKGNNYPTANIGVEKGNRKKGNNLFVNGFKEANLIVAALIATVTFTASFTMPGGYVSEKGPLQGTPVLGKSPAFKSFIIMDAIAMVLSSCAVFFHIFLNFRQESSRIMLYLTIAFLLTTLAIAAMVVAFVTATYAVVDYSTGLAIAICVIGLSFFIFFFVLFKKLYTPLLEDDDRSSFRGFGKKNKEILV